MSGDRGDERPVRAPASILWHTDEAAFFGGICSATGDVKCRLIAERLPGYQSWDWAVWHQGLTLHGVASSALLARTAAEKVAMLWISG